MILAIPLINIGRYNEMPDEASFLARKSFKYARGGGRGDLTSTLSFAALGGAAG